MVKAFGPAFEKGRRRRCGLCERARALTFEALPPSFLSSSLLPRVLPQLSLSLSLRRYLNEVCLLLLRQFDSDLP